MRITRQIEMTVAEHSTYIIRKSSGRQTFCASCGEPMLTAEQTAKVFSITQRRIFQIIETGAAHFSEMETGAAMICLDSLAACLASDERK